VALTQKLRRIVDESVGYGLALEGISALMSLARKCVKKSLGNKARRSES